MIGPVIDDDAAAAALREVDAAQRRAGELRRYAGAGETLVAWGVVWLVCNLLSQWVAGGERSWLVGLPAAIAVTVARAPRRRRSVVRSLAAAAAILVLIALAVTILQVRDPRAVDAAISLAVAGGYIVVGLGRGLRFAAVGAAIAAAVALGWFADPAHLYLWLGVGGGGALIGSGLWLRRA